MDGYTDDEQVEKIKQWWAENGKSIIAGVVLGVGALLLWRGWLDYQQNHAAEASQQFAGLLTAAKEKQTDVEASHAETLLNDYDDTPYALLAALTLARVAVEADDWDEAVKQLEYTIANAEGNTIEFVARERLARVHIAAKNYDDALKVLSGESPETFIGLFNEIRGDAYRLKGDLESARESYRKASLSTVPVPNPDHLKMKLDDIGPAQ